jgi:hypothetical protein
MMSLFKDKRFAVTFTAVLCIFAVFLGSWRSIDGIKKTAAEAFVNPASDGWLPIGPTLYEKAGYAANALDFSKKYLSDSESERAKISELINRLQKDGLRPDEAGELNKELNARFDNLAAALDSKDMSDGDKKMLEKIKADFKSAQKLINNSVYNAVAAEQNEKLSGFPVSLFRVLMGIGKIPLYDDGESR